MNINQSNRERIGSSTLDTLLANNSTWQGSPTFTQHVGKHEENLLAVRTWRDKQQEAMQIEGLTRDKNVLRRLLTENALLLVAGCKSLANDTGDNALASSVNYSEGKLLKLREGTFIAACRQIASVATANAAALLAYGVTAQLTADVMDDTDSFESIHSKTRSKRSSVAVYTKNLAEAVRRMMNHLRLNLDYSIKQWTDAPDFIASYRNSRKIIDYGNTQTGLRGTITDEATGMTLKNILVEIVEADMQTTSDKRGVYTFGRVPFGKFTLRLRGAGYTTTEIPNVQLNDGVMMDYDITLMHEPVPVLVPVNP